MSESDTEKLVHALISNKLDYCNSILFGVKSSTLARLQTVQNRAARIVLGLHPCAPVSDLLMNKLHWQRVEQRIVLNFCYWFISFSLTAPQLISLIN